MNIKTIILYILIVGVLFMGLLGILQIGEKIKAPNDVSGVWIPADEFNNKLHDGCALIQIKKPMLTIEQSGVYILVLLNDAAKTRLQGKIQGNKIIVSAEIPANDNIKGCGNNIRLELISEFQKKDGDFRLNCKLSTPDCRDCQEIFFSALRRIIRNQEDDL